MAREALTAIPAIDLHDFEAGGQRREEFTDTTMRAFHDIGFVFLKAPEELATDLPPMYRAMEKLFDLPEDVKRSYLRADLYRQRGYTPVNTETGIQCRAIGPNGEDMPNHAENWFSGPDISPNHPLAKQYPSFYPANIWPREVPELQETITPVYNRLYDMGKMVLKSLESHLGKPADYFDGLVQDSPTLFRPLRYPAISAEEAPNTIGACRHTDINFITVLPAPTRDGLWVKTRAGAWIPGKAPAGHVLVQVGDMLQRVTGGYFLSAEHKVDAPVAQSAADKGRYSSALFVHPASNVKLEVIPHLTKYPENFPTITAAEFLLQRLQDIGLSTPEQE